MKLRSIEITSFRAYNNCQLFDFETQNGELANLIVLYAPNGFGKTSFFDAVEWAITGEISRISNNSILKADAKSHKGFILKNGDSSDDFGKVIFRDKQGGIFERHTKIKRGRMFNDYHEGQYDKLPLIYRDIAKSEYPSTHLLPHDKIDSFLRMTNPKGRYDSLKPFWDNSNDSELHKEIINIKTEGEKKYTELNSKKDKLLCELSNLSSVDSQISVVVERIKIFNDLGIQYKIDFDEQKVDFNTVKKLVEECVEFKRALSAEKDNLINRNTKLIFLIENYEQILRIKRNIQLLLVDLENNKSLSNRFLHRDEVQKKLSIIESNLSGKLLEKKGYDDTIKCLPKYLEAINKISRVEEELRQMKSNTTITMKLLAEKQKDQSILTRDISLKREELENVTKSLLQLESNSFKLKDMEIRRGRYETRIKVLSQIITKREEKRASLQSEVTKYQNLLNILDYDFVNNVELASFDIKLFIQTTEEFHSLESLKLKQHSLVDLYQKELETSTQVENLIALGMNIIELSNDPSCPLCNARYNNIEDMLNNINLHEKASNNLNSLKQQMDEIQLNIKEKELIFYHLKQNLKDKISEKININLKQVSNESTKIMWNYELQKRLNEKLFLIQSEVKLLRDFFSSLERQMGNVLITTDNLVLISKELQFRQESISKEILNLELNLSEATSQVNDVLLALNVIENNINIENASLEELKSNKIVQNVKGFLYSARIVDDIERNLTTKRDELVITISNDLKSLEEYKQLMNDIGTELTGKEQKELLDEQKNLREQISGLEEQVIRYDQLLVEIFESKEVDLKIIEKESFQANFSAKLNISALEVLSYITENIRYVERRLELYKQESDLKEIEEQINRVTKANNEIDLLLKISKEHIEERISQAFNFEIINEIYEKIDPHPDLTSIYFEPIFDKNSEPELNILTGRDSAEVSPTLYLSSAQLNILSLSIFFARALRSGTKRLETIFMDDPIQHLDSINILSFIDLLRTITSDMGRQVVISTHDENFYHLIKRKIDPEYYNSKFIELSSYGTVKLD
ncbi:hypothetical protein [Paenibacillus tundrae]|uniref:hypothetical protein n=1 Tax=Paenibacillus tundrae TaxID=528187 RepID=UPI0030CEA020